ncbi:hypothetical protein ACJX0J_038275, partial [Zea mays]
ALDPKAMFTTWIGVSLPWSDVQVGSLQILFLSELFIQISIYAAEIRSFASLCPRVAIGEKTIKRRSRRTVESILVEYVNFILIEL